METMSLTANKFGVDKELGRGMQNMISWQQNVMENKKGKERYIEVRINIDFSNDW